MRRRDTGDSLSGKARRILKKIGYYENAYIRAREKLETKFGGERCIHLKNLATLRGWRKLRHGRTFSCSGSSISLAPRSFNLTATGKLGGVDVQAFKYMCFARNQEDNLESPGQSCSLSLCGPHSNTRVDP